MPRYKYYKVTSIVKVDLDEEGWDSRGDETFGLAKMVTKKDGLADLDNLGSVMVDHRAIDKDEFINLSHNIFTEEGGI